MFGVTFALTTATLLYFFDFQQGNKNVGGMASTGIVDVIVTSEFGIEVDASHNAIAFGTLSRDGTANTLPPPTGSGALPFVIRNVGNEVADVEICANPNLWSGASKLPSDYQFSVAASDPRLTMDNCESTSCFDASGSSTAVKNMPLTCPVGALAVNDLQWVDDHDEAIVHIYVHVPTDEPSGTKNSVVTLSAVSKNTY